MRVLIVLLLLVGCSSPHPTAPKTHVVVVRADVEVVVDDAWLAANPSLEWGEGRAWPLEPLLGSNYRDPSAHLRVTPRSGEAVVFEAPGARRDGRVPLLVVNRKGEVLVTLGDTAAGPSNFHGRGGARKRTGDEGTRVLDVVRVALEAGSPPAKPASKLPVLGPIEVATADGTARAPITPESLTAVADTPLLTDDGTPLEQRHWDLREVSRVLLDGQRVTSILDGRGDPLAISQSDWEDLSKVPALRVNKQGHWRFQWVVDGKPQRRAPGVRNVSRLIVTP